MSEDARIEINTRDNGTGGVLVLIDLDGDTLGTIDIDCVPRGARLNVYNDQVNELLGTLVLRTRNAAA